MRSRDVAHERHLTDIAARAAGTPDAQRKLDRFAEHRALPGGVQVDGRDFDREVMEEFADARNYLVWGIQEVLPGLLAGEPVDSAIYDRRMRALSGLIRVWTELMTEPT